MNAPALHILDLLDRLLDRPVELTLYGRAALLLGYSQPLPDFGQSLDVDAVLWTGQAEALQVDSNFWDALDRLNAELEPRGWYMTHLFTEDQVILRPDWSSHRVALPRAYTHLRLYRLADADLLLSKLMRDDPQDLRDALYIVSQAGFGPADVERLIRQARIPDNDDIREQFGLASERLLGAMRRSMSPDAEKTP